MDTIADLRNAAKDFKQTYFIDQPELFAPLKTGQQPKVMLITCADSRISPDILFNKGPGELFMVRNVANLIHAYDDHRADFSTRAALEYAVLHLGVEHLLVLGHSQCGGIRAAIEQAKQNNIGEFIDPWLTSIIPTATASLQHCDDIEGQCLNCEQASISQSLKHLSEYPWIKERIQNGKLHLHGWHFDLQTGDISEYDANKDCFTRNS